MVIAFKDFWDSESKREKIEKLLLDWNCYQLIPGTRNSYRVDAANTSTMTKKHAAVYSKANGKGKELYAVNIDGTGHDGSFGFKMPKKHAEYFRSINFDIPDSGIIESISISQLLPSEYDLIFAFSEEAELEFILEQK
ncbi:MAG: hypothetical protein JJT96_20765 [Opitutales bacterium]|nr:hypothetical protein [Opitutales bacterium]